MNTYQSGSPSFPFKAAGLLALLTLLSACDSLRDCPGGNCPSDEEVLARAGAVRMTPDEVRARNIGYTEQWLRGGAYYREDGTMRAKWRKVYYNGTWEIEDDGRLCYQLPRWQSRCHFYMQIEGDVYLLDEGRNIGISLIFRGDQLKNVGSFKPYRDRRNR